MKINYIDIYKKQHDDDVEVLEMETTELFKQIHKDCGFSLDIQEEKLVKETTKYFNEIGNYFDREKLEHSLIKKLGFKYHLELVEVIFKYEDLERLFEEKEGSAFSFDKVENIMKMILKSMVTGLNYTFTNLASYFVTNLFKDTDSAIEWFYKKYGLVKNSFKYNEYLAEYIDVEILEGEEFDFLISFEVLVGEHLEFVSEWYISNYINTFIKNKNFNNVDIYYHHNLMELCNVLTNFVAKNIGLGKNVNYLGVSVENLAEYQEMLSETIIKALRHEETNKKYTMEEYVQNFRNTIKDGKAFEKGAVELVLDSLEKEEQLIRKSTLDKDITWRDMILKTLS